MQFLSKNQNPIKKMLTQNHSNPNLSQAPNSVAIVEEHNTKDNDRNNGENDADISSESDQDDE